MRLAALFFSILVSTFTNAQSTVHIEFNKLPEKVIIGEAFQLSVLSDANASVELAIFSDTFLGFQANADLAKGIHEYKIETKNWPAGKYFVLAKGEDIHVQQEILVMRP